MFDSPDRALTGPTGFAAPKPSLAAAMLCAALLTPSALANPTEPQVKPSGPGRFAFSVDRESGTITANHAPLRRLVALCLNVHPQDLVFEPEHLADATYDAGVEAKGADLAPARAALREALTRDLGLHFAERPWRGTAQVLSRVQGGAELPRAEGAAPSFQIRPGQVRASAIQISRLARFLRSRVGAPVVDETGLEGRFDFVLEWDPKASAHALPQALEDLGLQMHPAERRLVQWSVRAADGAPADRAPAKEAP